MKRPHGSVGLRPNRRAALRVAAIYLLAAAAWVFVTHCLPRWFVPSLGRVEPYQTANDMVFVFLTGIVFYALLCRHARRILVSEEALRESQRALSTLVSNLPGMVYRCASDADWTMAYVSEGSLELTGYEPSELQSNRRVAYAQVIHPDDRDRVQREVQSAVSKAEPFELTYRIVTARGREKWVWEGGRAVESPADGVVLEGFITDVTARMAAEAAKLASERRYRELYENSLDGVVYCDADGAFLECNSAYEEMLGYTKAELRQMTHRDVTPPQWWDTGGGLIKERIETRGYSGLYEKEYVRKDGTAFPVELSVYLMRDDQGRPVGTWGLVRDITERKEARAALQRERDFAESLIESAQVMVLVLDTEGRILRFNPYLAEISGYQLGEVAGMDWFSTFLSEGHRDTARRAFGDTLRDVSVRGLIIPIRTKGGRERQIEWYGKALRAHGGNVTGVLLTGQDITERRRAEEALGESEEMLRLLFEHASDGINVAEYDPETAQRRLVSCNQRYVELSGRSREELLAAENLNAFVEYPHSRAETLEWHRSTLGGVPYRGTGSWRRPDGKENTYEWTAAPIRRGDKILIVGVDRDITERLQAERALREHEEMLRLLFDHAYDGINVVEFDTRTKKRRLITCNERYVEMSGRTREQLLAADDLNLFATSPNWREKADEWKRLRREGLAYQGTAVWNRPDGKENYYEWTAVPVKRGDKTLIFGIDRDITERVRSEQERVRLEHQLMQAQKLEAIGTLAGGVAHDFNNLLTGIIGYANLLKMDADPEAELYQTSAAIESAARRGGQLTAQLLTFARKSRRENVPLNMHEIVAEIAELLRRTLGENIAVDLDLKAPGSIVRGDPAGLQRVVLNLAVNARDAMPDGGRLGIESAVADLAEGDARLQTGLKPGRYFVLSVADTGCGVPDEIRDRIFEPFFTTKPPGQGTGMGLAIAYGTVRDHGGAVQVAGQVARGATFHVYLPLADSDVAVADQPAPGEPVRGSGRILVVDDEEVVRDSAARMLRGLGYHVAAAEDGPRAVEYFRARHAEIDAVIIDMVMPGMSGIDCFLALKKIDPDVKAVLTTGYGLSAEAGRIVEQGLLGFVEKPYGLFRLSQAVARAVLH